MTAALANESHVIVLEGPHEGRIAEVIAVAAAPDTENDLLTIRAWNDNEALGEIVRHETEESVEDNDWCSMQTYGGGLYDPPEYCGDEASVVEADGPVCEKHRGYGE